MYCTLLKMPVLTFAHIDEVIDRINAAPNPLALYLYSRDSANIGHVLQQTASGGACVNHALLHFLHTRLPFGGLNHSGIGNAHGQYGFKAFSHEKAVLQSRFSGAAKLFSAGQVPGAVRAALKSAFRWL